MTLTPLATATAAIQLHTAFAVAALLLGIVQLSRRKGDTPHRLLGYIWAGMMLAIALTSFFIHQINQWMGFSLIHLLSIFVLINVPLAIVHARGGKIGAHKMAMIGTFVGGLVVAGLFTLVPGRLMYAVLFGN